jgi:hypothetical protein
VFQATYHVARQGHARTRTPARLSVSASLKRRSRRSLGLDTIPFHPTLSDLGADVCERAKMSFGFGQRPHRRICRTAQPELEMQIGSTRISAKRPTSTSTILIQAIAERRASLEDVHAFF